MRPSAIFGIPLEYGTVTETSVSLTVALGQVL